MIHKIIERMNKSIRSVKYVDGDNLSKVAYLDNSKAYHNTEDKPSIVEYYDNGNIYQQQWHIHGRQKRLNIHDPVVITYNRDGTVREEEFKEKNIKIIKSYKRSKLVVVMYLDEYDKLHNEHGPAKIVYHENGKVYFEEYAIHGTYYNQDSFSPAITYYNDRGNVIRMDFYRHGMLYKTIERIPDWYVKGFIDIVTVGHL